MKRSDGKFYKVAVNSSCITWLHNNSFKFCLESGVDFAKPSQAEEFVYGIVGARKRVIKAIFNEAITAIQSRCDPGLDSWLRRAVSEGDGPSLEPAILDRDILVNRSNMRLKSVLTLLEI